MKRICSLLARLKGCRMLSKKKKSPTKLTAPAGVGKYDYMP